MGLVLKLSALLYVPKVFWREDRRTVLGLARLGLRTG